MTHQDLRLGKCCNLFRASSIQKDNCFWLINGPRHCLCVTARLPLSETIKALLRGSLILGEWPNKDKFTGMSLAERAEQIAFRKLSVCGDITKFTTKSILTFIIHIYFLTETAHVRIQFSVVFVIDRCDVNFAIVSDAHKTDTANPD